MNELSSRVRTGHTVRGRSPYALRTRRRRLWMLDLGSAAMATGVAGTLLWRPDWRQVVVGIVAWCTCLSAAGAHASAALRTRRYAVATLIAAVGLTWAILMISLVFVGSLQFALLWAGTLLFIGLAGRALVFGRIGWSPITLVLALGPAPRNRMDPAVLTSLGPGYEVAAILDPTVSEFGDQLTSVLSMRAIDQVILDQKRIETPEIQVAHRICRDQRIEVISWPELFEDATGRCLDEADTHLHVSARSVWHPLGARTLDIVLGLAMLAACAVCIPLSAVAGGRPLVNEEFAGGLRLRLLPRANQDANPLRRLLGLAALRVLPAGWALLRGKLALVGPAPLPLECNDTIPEYLWGLRRSVRPGLTGWARINGCCAGSHSLPYDLYYVRHRSLGFDLAILLRSVAAPLLSWRVLNMALEQRPRQQEEVSPGALMVSPSRELVSVIVPAFREGGRIEESLGLLVGEMVRLKVPFEVIVVSDGNDDGTEAEARRVPGPITVIHYSENRGKGYALRRGLAESRGDRIVFIDADMELRPDGIGALLAMLDAGADAAVGSKRHPESRVQYPRTRRFQSVVYQWIVRRLFGLDLTDTQAGIKTFRAQPLREAASSLTNDGFAFDLELLVTLHDRGAILAEGPVRLDYTFRSTTGLRAVREVLLETLRLWHRRRVESSPVPGVIHT